jgi:hypothetical protein
MHHWDFHKSLLTMCTAAVAASILFPTSPLLAVITTAALSRLFLAPIAQIMERRADSFAIAHATMEELQGGIAILKEKQQQKSNAWAAATSWPEQMEFLLQSLRYYGLEGHPFEATRIAKIESEYQLRLHTDSTYKQGYAQSFPSVRVSNEDQC